MGEDSFSALACGSTDRWLAVHVGAAVLFPLMAFLVWLLLRGVEGRAASVARVALPVFAVFYGVWEALTGIATGLVAQDGAAATGPARQALPTRRSPRHPPISGELGLFNSVGASPGSSPSPPRSSRCAESASAARRSCCSRSAR